MSDTPTIGGFDRDQEDQDIAREGVAAPGQPKRTGSVLDQLRAQFKDLDKQRTEIFTSTLKTGAPVWLEMDMDCTEEETDTYRAQAQKGNRKARRDGAGEVSNALFAAAVINAKNTRLWFEDPTAGAEHLVDTDGDPLTVHSAEWLEALDLDPAQPLDGLRAVFNDFVLASLSGTYLNVAAGDGASVVDPTSAQSGD